MLLRRLLALLVCVTLLPAHGQALPDLGDSSDAVLSERQEATIGGRIMREIRVDPAFIDDPEISDYLRSLGERLLAASDPQRRPVEFFVVLDETVNAFALIGGHIGIHSGLFLLTRNEAELAGVVGHEIAHLLQRHQSRLHQAQGKFQLASLAAFALGIIAASRGGSGQSAQVAEAALTSASAIAIQGQLNYTRDHEREADRVGIVLLERAGFDPRGMVSFFDRMQRANRLAEFKSAPSYLRTHPLTAERIADMQGRVDQMAPRLGPDSFDYRLARAKLRATAGTTTEAVAWFRSQLAEQSVLRPREEVYGLALALRRARDFPAAARELAPLRQSATTHPAFEALHAQLLGDLGQRQESLAAFEKALVAHPHHRGLAYGYAEALLDAGRAPDAVHWLVDRTRIYSGDAHSFELLSKAYAATGQRLLQHRAQSEAYFRRGNLGRAVDQLEIAIRIRDADEVETSIAAARLRELRGQLQIQKEAEQALKIG
jgi:predicted Zn-dependent protease